MTSEPRGTAVIIGFGVDLFDVPRLEEEFRKGSDLTLQLCSPEEIGVRRLAVPRHHPGVVT